MKDGGAGDTVDPPPSVTTNDGAGDTLVHPTPIPDGEDEISQPGPEGRVVCPEAKGDAQEGEPPL
jgi:hypothetical protein